MMGILKHAEEQRTGRQRPQWTRIDARLDEQRTGQKKPGEFIAGRQDIIEEHVIKLTVESRFWAVDVHYETARRAAERSLLHHLYRDVLSEFSVIESALIGQDYETAIQAIGRVRAGLGLS